jgi:hypothetical protein
VNAVGDQCMKSLNNIGPEDNKSICDGLGCFNESTHRIDEDIGNMGRIKLDLCDDCLLKFR